jgi:hypothetical protein
MGVKNLYLSDAERTASIIKNAVNSGVVRLTAHRIIIYTKSRDINSNNAINWSLCEGYIFKFYGSLPKNIVFIDSAGMVNDRTEIAQLKSFNLKDDECIALSDSVKDISDIFLQHINQVATH